MYRKTVVLCILSAIAGLFIGLFVPSPAPRSTSNDNALNEEVSAVSVALARKLQADLDSRPSDNDAAKSYEQWKQERTRQLREIYRLHNKPLPPSLVE